MFKTIVTNTKSRRYINYLFKNNGNKTPNAINYLKYALVSQVCFKPI